MRIIGAVKGHLGGCGVGWREEEVMGCLLAYILFEHITEGVGRVSRETDTCPSFSIKHLWGGGGKVS